MILANAGKRKVVGRETGKETGKELDKHPQTWPLVFTPHPI